MHKRIINYLTYIASTVYSEKVRMLFLLSLVCFASIAYVFFSYVFDTYFKTIYIYEKLNLDKYVYWIITSNETSEERLKSVKQLEALPEVDSVILCRSSISDVFVNGTDSSYIYQNYSFLNSNLPLHLKEGKLPLNANEVVISETTEDIYHIGDVLNCTITYGSAYDNGNLNVYTATTDLTIVGIAYRDSVIMRSGYSLDHRSNLIGFFSTIAEEEENWTPIIPYMYINGIDGVENELYSLTAYVLPAEGYSQEDVIKAASNGDFDGFFQVYSDMKNEYDNYCEGMIDIAWISGVSVGTLLIITIVTGVVLGIESNKKKMLICSICGGTSSQILALSLGAYIPSIFIGNVIGLGAGQSIINCVCSTSFVIPWYLIIYLVIVELMILFVILIPYLLRGYGNYD